MFFVMAIVLSLFYVFLYFIYVNVYVFIYLIYVYVYIVIYILILFLECRSHFWSNLRFLDSGGSAKYSWVIRYSFIYSSFHPLFIHLFIYSLIHSPIWYIFIYRFIFIHIYDIYLFIDLYLSIYDIYLSITSLSPTLFTVSCERHPTITSPVYLFYHLFMPDLQRYPLKICLIKHEVDINLWIQKLIIFNCVFSTNVTYALLLHAGYNRKYQK